MGGAIVDAWKWTQELTGGITMDDLLEIPEKDLKMTTNQWARAWRTREWDKWSHDKPYSANRQGRYPNKFPAHYLTNTSNKLQCSLKAAFRMTCAFLGGNKTSREKNNFCRFCNTQTPENEVHILLSCKGLAHERQIMWSKCPPEIATEGRANNLPGPEQDDFAALLLGALTVPPTESRSWEVPTDLAVKSFLAQANIMLTLTHRKGLLEQTWTRQEVGAREEQDMDHWDSTQRVSKWMQRYDK
jgi:hypothetical protein